MTRFDFELIHYGEDGNGERVTIARKFTSDSGAKAAAGRLAKRINGPVDLARVGAAGWRERYLTTAEPSQWHASGYSLGRVE